MSSLQALFLEQRRDLVIRPLLSGPPSSIAGSLGSI